MERDLRCHQARKRVGLCNQDIDSTIVQINIGLKDNSLNDHLMVMNAILDELELMELSR